MTWIKLDDNAVDHPKLASLSDRAFRWWIRGLSYASRFLTDGLLPPVFWKAVHRSDRKELTDNRLWDWVDPNFLIHDYAKHQSLKEDVEADKERARQNAKAYRDRRKSERRQSNVIDDASSQRQQPVIAESSTQIQRTDTENREQRTETTTPPPLKPLISGNSNPRNWGRIHGDHVPGFCDWVCLPDFVFDEFRVKSPGAPYVREWALKVRAEWEGKTIGDNLKFWREQWQATHATKLAKTGTASITAQIDAWGNDD